MDNVPNGAINGHLDADSSGAARSRQQRPKRVNGAARLNGPAPFLYLRLRPRALQRAGACSGCPSFRRAPLNQDMP